MEEILNKQFVNIYKELLKDFRNIRYYYCNKCKKLHILVNSKIFKEHILFSKKITYQERRNLTFKKSWNKAKKEQIKFGAVNLPRKRNKKGVDN